ncbi:MAG: MBL fold metallo-hydrolase [Helicobacteraceae bacterium]|jgi:ribonuclease BN (tRNA processing enzyme)|nr:MBL fold metallo-hydrolase [Helicobacteraceae bacterium]
MKTLFLLLIATWIMAADIEIEVLGSGGPEVDGRASASYLLWIDGKARLLIDAGSGSMLLFEQSGAKLEDLEAIALTHLHIDHVVDLPSYIKAGYFSSRKKVLPIIGPIGNQYFPDTNTFLQLLFGEKGVYRYMSDVLTPQSDSFEITAESIDAANISHHHFKSFELSIINVNHDIIPALGFRIDADGKSIVISGDTRNLNGQLEKLTQEADIFIAHHAIPQIHGTYANTLHMTPAVIADIAHKSNVKKVVLSHRMKRTIGNEEESLKLIRESYKGEVVFAEERMKIKL